MPCEPVVNVGAGYSAGGSKIRNYAAKVAGCEQLQAVRSGCRTFNFVSSTFQRRAQKCGDRWLILNQQNSAAGHGRSHACAPHCDSRCSYASTVFAATGRRTMKVDPMPSGLFRAEISPECARTMP